MSETMSDVPSSPAVRVRIALLVHFLLCLWVIAISAVCLSLPAIEALRGACCVFTLLAVWLVFSWVWIGEQILSLYLLFLASVLVFNGRPNWAVRL